MVTSPYSGGRAPVPVDEVRIESLGVNALDRRRVDVAIDLTPCRQPLTVKMAIVGPGDEELCSAVLIENREWVLDRVLHLRQDAAPGEHTLHVGLFDGERLVTLTSRRFRFPPAGGGAAL